MYPYYIVCLFSTKSLWEGYNSKPGGNQEEKDDLSLILVDFSLLFVLILVRERK